MHASFDIVVDRSPEEVFAYLADLLNMPDWYPTIDSAEHVGGEPGQVGARYRLVNDRKLFDDLVFDYKVTGVEPGRQLDFALDHPKVTGTERYVVEPAEGGTRVRFDSDGAYTKLNKLLTPAAVLGMKAIEGTAGKQLKAALERGA